LEQTKAQLVATEDRVRTILQSWEKSKTNYVRLPKKAYQDCQRAHGGPHRRHIARRRPYTIPWYDRVKKTDYVPRAATPGVPPPPQLAVEEEEEDPEIQVYYFSDKAAESIGEHVPAQ